jgi:hypothetical protein
MTLAEAMLQAADELEETINRCNDHDLRTIVGHHLRLIRTVTEFARRKEITNDPNRSCAVCGKGNGGRSRRKRQGGV